MCDWVFLGLFLVSSALANGSYNCTWWSSFGEQHVMCLKWRSITTLERQDTLTSTSNIWQEQGILRILCPAHVSNASTWAHKYLVVVHSTVTISKERQLTYLLYDKFPTCAASPADEHLRVACCPARLWAVLPRDFHQLVGFIMPL